GLETGGYSAKLCIANNDPAQPMLELPVTLGVNNQQTYSVGGTIAGMLGSGMKLRLNSGSNMVINSNGPFTFSTLMSTGEAYSVAITSQPSNPAQVCTLSRGSGVIGASNVVDVEVNCLSGPSDVIFVHGFDD
ncbi:MAG: hypothetical protein ABIY56_04570, partial [Dokdonella sp.]